MIMVDTELGFMLNPYAGRVSLIRGGICLFYPEMKK